MKSSIFTLLLSLLVTALAATAPALTILYPVEPQRAPLQLRKQEISVTIDGPVARTDIKQTFFNPQPVQLEGVYLITLPGDAQVTDFVMTINGERMHAEVLEAAEARKTYTEIVRRVRDPGLLEHVDGKTYRLRVFPIPANGEMPIELSFAQTLGRIGNFLSYELAATAPKGFGGSPELKLDLKINSQNKLGSVYSPTHKIEKKESETGKTVTISVPDYKRADSAFQLYFAPAQEGVGLQTIAFRPKGDEDGFFLLMLTPPRAEAAEEIAKTVTFVLDVSGSMAHDNKLEKAKSALIEALASLNTIDSFNIYTFSTRVDAFKEQAVPANKVNLDAARAFITDLRPRGGTNIEGALVRSLSEPTTDTLHQVVFITDGYPTVGTTNILQLIALLKRQNTRNLRVFSVGVGYDINTKLIDSMAEETRALAMYIEPEEDIEVKIGHLTDSISQPVMVNVKLDIANVNAVDVYPTQLPDLFAGQDMIIFGRYRQPGKADIKLAGEINKKQVERKYTADFPAKTENGGEYVANLWASRKVGYLLDEVRKNGEDKELKDEVIALAEEYNLVTPYTSYLIVDDSEFVSRRPEHGTAVSPDFNLIAPSNAATGIGAYTYDPTNGTVSEGDAWRVHNGGRTSVQTSRALGELKSADRMSASPQASLAVRLIGSDKYTNKSGVWIQDGDHSQLPVVKIKYLSDAYFELLKTHPEKKKAITLGEKVHLVIDGKLVKIGEEGIDSVAELTAAMK